MKNYNKNFILLIFGFLFIIFSIIVFSDTKWKLKIKGQEKEILTNPIIKGTNVFVDIYDLSNLFNIDYEINLTRKYIMFYKNINLLPTNTTNNISITSTTNNTTINTNSYITNFSNNYSLNNENIFDLNKTIIKEINSIRDVVIINPINEIKPLYKDSIVYKDELNNVKEKINDSFISKFSIPIVVDKNQNINKLDLREIIEYLNKKNVSAAIIPIVRAYEYHEKSENIMNPEVQLILDYILINNKGFVLFFDSQNIIRGLAVFSSSSTRYRKSKLLDLIDLSVHNFINDFNRYKEILSKF
jgi:hypothetical protein